jgi:hypothetical protein
MSYVPSVPQGVVPSNGAAREKLFRVAKYQRWVLLSVLANIVVFATSILNSFEVISLPSSTRLILGIALIAIATLMILSAFMLANQFYRDATSILCALLMWVPFVSLIVLLIINQKATGYLKQHGIKVGLLGTNPARI